MLYITSIKCKREQACPYAVFWDRYQWHRSLCRAIAPPILPDEVKKTAIEHSRLQFDLTPSDEGMDILVYSRTPPDWSRLEDSRIDMPADIHVKVMDIPEKGSSLHFEVLARPSVKSGSRRRFIDQVGEQIGWLFDRAARSGFSILAVEATSEEHSLPKRGTIAEKLRATRFKGELSITDPALFMDALERGFGPSKAIGFGLMKVRCETSK